MNKRKLHILIAEQDPGETAPALHALYPEGQDRLELTTVSSVATLEIVNPEVIFLDLALAHPNPLGAVRARAPVGTGGFFNRSRRRQR